MRFLKYLIGTNIYIWVFIDVISFGLTIGGIIKEKNKNENKKITKILCVFTLFIFILILAISLLSNILVEVPNVIGLNRENAKQTILESNLFFVIENEDSSLHKVEKQIPEPGTYLKKDETVTLYLEEFEQEPLGDLDEKKDTAPLEEFPFYTEYNIIYPEAKEIKLPTPEESGTYSMDILLDLRAEEYKSEKVPINSDIHGFVVDNLYYCSDDDSVTDVSGYNYYKFADYWFYLHTIDISFTEFDDFVPSLNGAKIVLQEIETKKRIVLQEDYLDGQFVQFRCSTGQYIIEVQKGGIAYTRYLNIDDMEKTFLALSKDDYYYLSESQDDSYIDLKDIEQESQNDNDDNEHQETTVIPDSVLSIAFDIDVQSLIDEGEYIEAAELYKSKISEPTPEDWCNVGDILNYYMRDYEQAAIYYFMCLQYDPTYERANKGLDYAYDHLSNNE